MQSPADFTVSTRRLPFLHAGKNHQAPALPPSPYRSLSGGQRHLVIVSSLKRQVSPDSDTLRCKPTKPVGPLSHRSPDSQGDFWTKIPIGTSRCALLPAHAGPGPQRSRSHPNHLSLLTALRQTSPRLSDPPLCSLFSVQLGPSVLTWTRPSMRLHPSSFHQWQ